MRAGIADVKRIVILVDLNPIQLPIDYRLDDAEPFIATRIKLDQRTPVRGAVQLADGSWLVSGGWIDAAGGGCSAPPASRVSGDWAQHLGEVRGGLWRTATGPRAQIAFRHPMDTGFVANIASYYIDQLTLTGADGRSLGMVAMQAAVAEDPVLTLLPHARTGEVALPRARHQRHRLSGHAGGSRRSRRMIDRRTLIAAAGAALAAPVLGQALAYRLTPHTVGDGIWLIRGPMRRSRATMAGRSPTSR